MERKDPYCLKDECVPLLPSPSLGASVGSSVKPSVGSIVGTSVGTSVGIFVGTSVEGVAQTVSQSVHMFTQSEPEQSNSTEQLSVLL